MILVIDAFNAIYKFDDLEEHMHRGQLESAIQGFIKRMAALQKAWNKPLEIHIFFDGKKRQGDDTDRESVGSLRCYYSHEQSADYQIKQFLIACRSPGEVRTISSDKQVQHFAKKSRAHVQSSEEFAKWVQEVLSRPTKNPEKIKEDPSMSPRDLAYWMDMFKKRK
ncbi:MAG: NYN domain-containing protein [Leptospiraceae bacterium]|nr:NYN domain-containing protein [Leptospiraceae bacterium]MCB1303489.1 NYN domain-containing protein [Leptospiraceae bacterium]